MDRIDTLNSDWPAPAAPRPLSEPEGDWRAAALRRQRRFILGTGLFALFWTAVAGISFGRYALRDLEESAAEHKPAEVAGAVRRVERGVIARAAPSKPAPPAPPSAPPSVEPTRPVVAEDVPLPPAREKAERAPVPRTPAPAREPRRVAAEGPPKSPAIDSARPPARGTPSVAMAPPARPAPAPSAPARRPAVEPAPVAGPPRAPAAEPPKEAPPVSVAQSAERRETVPAPPAEPEAAAAPSDDLWAMRERWLKEQLGEQR